jgi:hypothetical protein
VSYDKVYRPFFFEEKAVNGIIYRDMLELWLIPQLLEDKPNVFQHDGAPPRIHNEVTIFLNCLSGGSDEGGSTFWPPQSPDLDFFLWGFVIDEVYVPPMPITLSNFKNRIRTATAKTDQSLLQNVWHKVEYRLDVCRATNGAHIELAQGTKKLFELFFTMVCV